MRDALAEEIREAARRRARAEEMRERALQRWGPQRPIRLAQELSARAWELPPAERDLLRRALDRQDQLEGKS